MTCALYRFGNFKANHPNKDQLELVFLSSDRDEPAFAEYFAEMKGFHAVPYANRDSKVGGLCYSLPLLTYNYPQQQQQNHLSTKFGVRGIPTLVFVDADGNTLSKDGRRIVMEDDTAKGFPWKPKTLADMLGSSFVDNKGGKVSIGDLDGKVLGIYFSAHWCGPCRAFTPQLVSVYNTLKAAGKPFEIIFASSDRDEDSFRQYFGTMPWLTFANNADEHKSELSSHFEVEGIPTLVILDENRKVISEDGRSAVSSDPAYVHMCIISNCFDSILAVLISHGARSRSIH